MLDSLARLLEVSSRVAAALLVLIVVQLAMQLYALVDLTRRGAVRGARKWVWALVIVLLGLPGAIAYLAAGRPPSTVDMPTSGVKAAREDAARRAVDTLYGPRGGDE